MITKIQKNLIIGIIALIAAYAAGVLVGNEIIHPGIGTGILFIAGFMIGGIIG